MGFGFSGGVYKVYEYSDLPSFKYPKKPNARYDFYRGGKLIRSRYTDAQGKPYMDKDYAHSDNGTHIFPHFHMWIGKTHGRGFTFNELGEKVFFEGENEL